MMDSQIQEVRRNLVEIKSKLVGLHVLNQGSLASHETKVKLESELEEVQGLLLVTETSLKRVTAAHPEEKYLEELGYLADDLHRQLQNFQNLQKKIREQSEQERAILEEEAKSPVYEKEESSPLLGQENQKRAELFGEIALNESIIAERDAGIQEIQRAIYDVNEIFRDLGMLVSEQAGMLSQVEENVETAAMRTRSAVTELHRANETRRRKSWTFFKFIAALLFGIIMIILIRDLIL